MNNLFKKGVAIVASMGVLASTINVTALGASLVNEEFTAAYGWAYENGVTTMTSEESFLPYANVTREAVAKMAYNGLEAASCLTLEASRTYDNDFADLANADDTLEEWIVKAYEAELVNGWDGKYHAQEVVTRGQFMTMIGRARYGMLPESAEYWKNYYELLKEEGIFTVENAMAPVKRYEAALVLYRIAEDCENDDSDDNIDDILCEILDTCEGDDNDDDGDDNNEDVVVRGDVTVSLSADSPATQYITKDRQDVTVMVLDVKAGDEDATIETLLTNLEGEIDNDQIKEAFVYNADGVELDSDNFDNSNKAEFSIDAEDFTVAAGTTEQLYIVVDMDPDAFSGTDDGGIFSIAIDADGIEGATSVGGSFPLFSHDVVVFNRESSYSVTLDANVQNPGTFEAGEDVEVVDLSIENDNERDMVFYGMTLYSDFDSNNASGSLQDDIDYDDDLENVLDVVNVIVDGDEVDYDVTIDGDKIMIALEEGYFFDEDIDVSVEARRVGGEADDVISLVLEDTTDISIVEDRTGYNVQVSYDADDGTDDDEGLLLFYTELGDVESRFDDSSDTPSNDYINFGAQRETIFVGLMTLEKDANIETLTVDFNGSALAVEDGIEKIELYIDGSRVESVNWDDLDSNTSHEFDVDEDYDMGTYEIEVRVDVTDDDDLADDIDGTTIRAELNSNAADGEYADGDDLVFEGSASGNTQTIKTSNVTVTKTSVSGDDQIVEGANDVHVYSFKIRANDAADLELKRFTVGVTGAALTGASDIRLQAEMGSESKTKNTNSSWEALFSSLNWVIAAGETATVDVYADLPSDIATGALEFTIDDIEIEDVENDITFDKGPLAAQTFNVNDSAVVTATTNSSNPANLTLVPNQEEVIAVMGLEAENDDVDVSKLLFALTGLSGVDYTTIIDSADLWVDGAVVASASPETVAYSGTTEGDFLYFNLYNDVRLIKDEVETFSVQLKTADFDSDDLDGVTGGIQVEFDPASYSSDLETRMVAVNVTSSATIVADSTFTDVLDDVRAATIVANAANATTVLGNANDLFTFSLTAQGDDAYLSGVKVTHTKIGDIDLTGTMDVEDDGNNVVGQYDTATNLITFDNTMYASGYNISENDSVEFTIVGSGITINEAGAQVRFTIADNDSAVVWGVDGTTFDYDGDDVTGLPTGTTTAE